MSDRHIVACKCYWKKLREYLRCKYNYVSLQEFRSRT